MRRAVATIPAKIAVLRGDSQTAIARTYGVHQTTVGRLATMTS